MCNCSYGSETRRSETALAVAPRWYVTPGVSAGQATPALTERQRAARSATPEWDGATPQMSAYQVSQVDFLNVLNAQITLYNAQISYWEALSSAKQSLANLAASAGAEVLYE